MTLKTDLQKTLGTGEFEYGNHEIAVEVKLEENYGDYLRTVHVVGHRDGRDEVKHKSLVQLDPDPESAVPERISRIVLWSVAGITAAAMGAMLLDARVMIVGSLFGLVVVGFLAALGIERHYGKEKPVVEGLESQLERTVRTVFDKLDEFYEYSTEDYDIDIDVSIDKVKHEISWIEIEDDLDRILAETENIA